MNKEQIDQLALEIYRGTDWEERLTVEQAVISLTTRFLARVDAERAKEGPVAVVNFGRRGNIEWLIPVDEDLGQGTELFINQRPIPEGYKLVPDAFLKKLVDFFERSPTLSSTNYYETRNSLYSSAAAMLEAAPEVKP